MASEVRASTAAICDRFALPPAARGLLREGISARSFVAALLAAGQNLAAIDFIAHALPAREAIWWGALCLRHACGDALTPAEHAAAKAAVRWVLLPDDSSRAAATAPAETAGMATVAGMLAQAVRQSGGGPVAPPPYAPAKSVGAAIRLATLKAPPPRIQDTQRLYAELGMQVALGRCPIPEAALPLPRRRAS